LAPGFGDTRRYDDEVDVVISESARDYIERRGGTVFVRPHRHRCCSGALTTLDTSVSPPTDAAAYESFPVGGIDVHFRVGSAGRPSELAIELRGLLHAHPVAFWDGCAYKP
jgi:hypothetical protein